MKVLFVWPNKDSFGYKPIAISLLSGISRNLGWDTDLFDTTGIDFGFTDNTEAGVTAKVYKPVDLLSYGHKKEKLDLESIFIKKLEEMNPDLLAFSVLSDEYMIAAQISGIAKRMCPEIPIIWGGKYPTLNPEKVLNTYHADFVCIGEGIDAFSDFLKALSEKGDLYNIPNIYAKRNDLIVKNSIRPLKKNLDELPYVDWEIFDKRHFVKPFDGKVYISGDHMLNWGCPYHCTYCINHFLHETYNNNYFLRRYSVKRIIDELRYLKDRYCLEFMKFHDEDFLMRPVENLRELSEAYKKEINIPFTIETNPKSVTKEKVELLKEMNCISASVAIETGDTKIRKELLKRVDSEEDVMRAFSLLREAGIRTVSFNMLGIPFETRETYEETILLNRRANIQYPDIGFFYPFEGTELRKIAIKEGFYNKDDISSSIYKRDRPALRFDNLSEGELIEMRNVFVLYVKLPEEYASYIQQSEHIDNRGKELRKKLLEIYDKTVFVNNGWYSDSGFKDVYLKELNEILKLSK